MELEHLYWRIVTATLGALLCVCALLAGAKFIRSRANVLSLLMRARGVVFAVLMGAMAMTTMIIGSMKQPTNQMMQVGFPRLPSMIQLRSGNVPDLITEVDVSNGWRVAETREGCEIVWRDVFAAPQIHAPWFARGGYKDKTRIVPCGWSFPWRDGTLDCVTVLSEGEFRPNIHTHYFPPLFDAPLAVVPSFNWHLLPSGVSNVFWYAVSPSNSLIVTWENSPVSRDVNCLTNFQAELFSDGRFAYRYDDHAVEYAPVFPFDWDGDGLENSIDPEPLVAGSDAHGTNLEWYNVVCANIVNSNAYYIVEVVASHGPAPIYFNADRESFLGSPIVIARSGETNHVPLLMGVEYLATSTVPFSVSVPSNATATVTGICDGRSFSVKWPITFELSPDNGGYAVDVQPFDPGGAFSWTPTPCSSSGPCLLSGTPCSFATNGSRIGFTGCGDCDCGGRSIDGTYALEGASFTMPSLWCGCTAHGQGGTNEPPSAASVSVSFDKSVVFYEDAYTNAPSDVVARRSTCTTLSISAYGGATGGMLLLTAQNMDRLSRTGGANLHFPYMAMIPSGGSVSFAVDYEAARHSDAADDIIVNAAFTPSLLEAVSDSAAATAVKVQLEAMRGAPLDGNTSRHIYGVKEEVACWHWPKSLTATWNANKGTISALRNTAHSFHAPLEGSECILSISVNNESYQTTCMILEPRKYYCPRVTQIDFGLGENEAGGVGMLLELYIAPRTVSFGNIAMQEIPTTEGGVSGYFRNEEFSGEWAHTTNHHAGVWHNIGNDNLFMLEDEASNPRILKPMTPDGVLTNDVSFGWQEGMIIWSIPLGWNEHNTIEDSMPARTNAVPEQQRFTILPNGSAGVFKAGHYVIRGTNTIITTGRLPE